jgi:hypothetical protein
MLSNIIADVINTNARGDVFSFSVQGIPMEQTSVRVVPLEQKNSRDDWEQLSDLYELVFMPEDIQLKVDVFDVTLTTQRLTRR